MVRRILFALARARSARDPPALRRGPRRDGRVRALRDRADPARVADRRGDRARSRAHGAGHRRLPERDLRERAGADHRAHRRPRGADRGRARLAHRLGDREPAARARLLAALRRARRDRPRVELRLLRADRHRHAALPGRRDPGLGRRSRPRLARQASIPVSIVLLVVYVASDVVLAAPAPRSSTSRATTRVEGWSFRSRSGRPRRRDGGHGARRRDPRRLAGGLRRESRASPTSSSPR